jgi:hypothetical protein
MRPQQHCPGVLLHVLENEGLLWCPRCGAIRWKDELDWLSPSAAEKVKKARVKRGE